MLPSLRVSRRHCAVRWTVSEGVATSLMIEDLGSSNGTVVNGRSTLARTALALHDGDVVEVGGVALAVAVAVGNGGSEYFKRLVAQ